LALSGGVTESRYGDEKREWWSGGWSGQKRPNERHEKRETCDGVEAFLDEPTGGEDSNHENDKR
jgi:hypothetical protein